MRLLSTLCVILLGGATVGAGDWSQWLGPNRDGSSPEKVTAWKDAPKVVWHIPAGAGHSAPVIAGGKAFVHAKGEGETEVVACYEADSGKEIWKQSYPRAKFSSEFGNGPRATPAVVGKFIYTFGVTGILSCFEIEKGKQIWQIDTLKDCKGTNPKFGMSSSPLVDDGKVFINVGAKGASIVAFNCTDGTVAWKSLDDGASYSSPIIFSKDKERQLVFLTAAELVSFKPADGTVLWKFPLKDALFESSTTPVLTGDLVLASSITYGSVALKLGTEDGKPTATKEWKNSLTCYFSTPVPVGKENVYMVTGSLFAGQADLQCVETKSGKVLWKKEKVGTYHASLLRTGDDKLLMLEEAGNLVLIDPNSSKYAELARSKVCGQTWVHPALANGKLYVRDGKELSCLQLE
jgi:outer membrane protein assembly factor BamB